MENYKKGVDLETLVRKLEDVYISSKGTTSLTGTGTKGPTEIAEKIYGLELEKHLDRADTLEDNMTNIYYLLWGQCNESLQQSLCEHKYFVASEENQGDNSRD